MLTTDAHTYIEYPLSYRYRTMLRNPGVTRVSVEGTLSIAVDVGTGSTRDTQTSLVYLKLMRISDVRDDWVLPDPLMADHMITPT